MQKLLGVFLILFGIVAGFYAGLWWAFIGGIMTLAQMVMRDIPFEVLGASFAVLKIMLAGLIGWACAIFPIATGWALLEKS